MGGVVALEGRAPVGVLAVARREGRRPGCRRWGLGMRVLVVVVMVHRPGVVSMGPCGRVRMAVRGVGVAGVRMRVSRRVRMDVRVPVSGVPVPQRQ